MKTVCLAALGACAIALPASAQGFGYLADPNFYLRGAYVEANGGASFQGATTEFNSTPGEADKGSGHFRAGYFGSGVFGKRVAPGLAFEVEGIYLNNHYDRETEDAQGTSGRTRTYGGLANIRLSVPYDYHVYRNFAVVPYVAAGAGYGQVRYDTSAPFHDSQSGFLWQAKAGLEIKTGTPVSFDFGYRYIGTPEDHQDFLGAGGQSSFQLRSHAQVATGGIKYTF